MTTDRAARLPLRSPLAEDLGLLTSKLARPRVPPTYVARPHINRLLDAGTAGPLTVVSAGPGWGKTLATAAWAASEQIPGPVAWVSLDDADNEPRQFWAYLAAGIRATSAVPPGNPLAGVAPGIGVADENLRRVTGGLAELPTPIVLVLDDFQVIHDDGVLASVAGLLRHPLPQLRLVLLTRMDPALPLHRLRVAGDLVEIRARDLAFGVEEAGALLATDGVTVDREQARLLVGRTEGWAAGLRLAALFLRRPELERSPEDFAGDDRAVTDYLAEEVLASQPPELRQFLVRTSIADRLTAGLADVLTGGSRGQQALEALERSNAFVVGLGSDRRWYRYHPLLREMLQHQLAVDEPEAVQLLHRRAAQWFAANGNPITALGHAADAQDWSLLGRLFVTHGAPLLLSTDRAALDAVLARIPAELFATSSELCLCAAARLLYANRFTEIQPHVDLAEVLLEDASQDVRSAVAVLTQLFSMAVARGRGDITGLLAAALSALDGLSGQGAAWPAAEQARAVAHGNLGTALVWSGRLAEAEVQLRKGLPVAEGTRMEVARINMLAHLGLAAALAGRLHQGFDHASTAVQLADARGWVPLAQATTAHLALAMIHLQWNNVDEARSWLARGRAAAAGEVASVCARGLVQSRLDASVGGIVAARDRIRKLRSTLSGWRPPPFLAQWMATTEAEIDLAAGDADSALTRVMLSTSQQPANSADRVCLARALLARGDLDRADDALAPARETAVDSADHPGDAVGTWLMTALVADRLREDDRAVQALRASLAAARTEGIRRPFVTWDHEHLPRLLARLQHVEPGFADFAAELLADIGQRPSPAGDAPEPMTDRELSVLRYLPTMMTNAEIAAELFVSVNTVKAHLKRIFRKLGVTNRRQAVHRARELGLLT
jgi:LuxR family maltose regulon positive regulatory protein